MLLRTAANFTEREAAQRRYETLGAETYRYAAGDYSARRSSDTIGLPGGAGALTGPEVLMARHLEQRLDAQPNSPIVGLDVGGGLGISMRRLGVYFQEAIAQSRLALAVSNMSEPTNFNSQLAISAVYDIPELRCADENPVHFFSSVFSKLAQQVITLPNGAEVPLAGNVSCVHERFSLTTWSQVPERDILQVGRMLTERDGLYMVPEDNISTPQSVGGEYYPGQVEGIRLGHAALRSDFGIERSNEYAGVRLGGETYAIFRSGPKPGTMQP